MHYLERVREAKPLEISAEKLLGLKDYITTEIEDALSARAMQEVIWNECLKLYEAIPETEIRDRPIEGFRNIEVPLIAISSDAIYAQAMDLIFTVSPLLTIQAVGKENVNGAKGLQRLANWGANSLFGLRNAAEHAILDNVQLGSGFYYIPYLEKRIKKKTEKVVIGGPRIFSVPPEDFIVPGGASEDLQTLPWVSMRSWLTHNDLAYNVKYNNWDSSNMLPAGHNEWVRLRRETLGRTSQNSKSQENIFEIFSVYAQFDIDGDGIEEDLYIIWDRTSQSFGLIAYNPFDSRPFSAMRYQLRSHLFYGIGVAEMLRTIQREESEIHNHRIINMMLANTKMFATSDSSIGKTVEIWPGRVLQVSNVDSFKELRISEVYPSSAQAEASAIALAERRVGLNEMSMPRPSQVLGSRTPGITMMGLMQQSNRRFAPAFDGVRLATSEAIRQCLYRMQEQVLANNKRLEKIIEKVTGEFAAEVIGLLGDESFDEAVKIELTASSAQQNREVERQNQLLLINIMSTYYKSTLELATIISNPQVPPTVKETAEKIVKAATEVLDRTLRTFDSVRDPESLLVEMGKAESEAVEGAPNEGVDTLSQIMGALAQMGQQGGGEVVPAFGG